MNFTEEEKNQRSNGEFWARILKKGEYPELQS